MNSQAKYTSDSLYYSVSTLRFPNSTILSNIRWVQFVLFQFLQCQFWSKLLNCVQTYIGLHWFLSILFFTIKKLFTLPLCFYPKISTLHHLRWHQVSTICSMSVLEQILNLIQTYIRLQIFLCEQPGKVYQWFTLPLCLYP